jgi:hypothetical protein
MASNRRAFVQASATLIAMLTGRHDHLPIHDRRGVQPLVSVQVLSLVDGPGQSIPGKVGDEEAGHI